MNIQDQLSPEVQHHIADYNANSKLNTFLYNNVDCNKLFGTSTTHNDDRWLLVRNMGKIEYKLIKYIHENFHDKRVTVDSIKGIIKHPLTRYYDNNGEQKETHNDVSFRSVNGSETIALWVETDNKFSTHLYTIDQITVIE